MQTRLILGPAGSGKTFRCLAEIRGELAAAPDGPPLLLIAPKQTTYQLERQLLADAAPSGYTRLHILSFDRLAFFLLNRLQQPPPRLLDDEGRVMVLRALLANKDIQLRLFHASARLTGFARQLSDVLRELQQSQQTPETLRSLAEQAHATASLHSKLHDLATLLEHYLKWLDAHQLHDAEALLDFTVETLRAAHRPLAIGKIWVDGFIELGPQELELLAELLPQTARGTVTFCLDRIPKARIYAPSHWAVVERAYHQFCERLAQVPDCRLVTELRPRKPAQSRFAENRLLGHLEANWAEPHPFTESQLPLTRPSDTLSPIGGEGGVRGKAAAPNLNPRTIRTIACADPEAETVLAAREIIRFVRGGARYRDIAVFTRRLPDYREPLANTFARYGIPFFMDQREPVSHHPLAELTRNALRTVAYAWKPDDWFGALKTGLVSTDETLIDQLENEALARGWKGRAWQQPINLADEPERSRRLESLRRTILPPFNQLDLALRMANQHRPTGALLAAALRELWTTLDVENTLTKWSTEKSQSTQQPIHLTVWDQMNGWLENLELAFSSESLPLREWLPILEAGLAGLSAGVVPPALDQVLIGAIDRSRNPEVRFAIVLGMNESIFPAPPETSVLLTDSDRDALDTAGVPLRTMRRQISRERFHGYLACTRAREKLLLTWSQADANGKPLNPSPFLSHLRELFPDLKTEHFPRSINWHKSEHANELVVPLLQGALASAEASSPVLADIANLPAVTILREQLGHLITPAAEQALSPAMAERLYGPNLRTSVSRMEQFAACPFKFFVHSGLRAEERKLFELDARDQGNFQHEILDLFHRQLQREGKRWRDITPAEARGRIAAIAAGLKTGFRDGLLQSSEQNRFAAGVLTETLQDFIETVIWWMKSQYAFDPVETEVPFGEGDLPPWTVNLGNGHLLLLKGRIDRIDLLREPNREEALCVVVDYKSSQRKLDALMIREGLQLQLPAYLNVLRHWPDPGAKFQAARLLPAGVFYVNLRGFYERGTDRNETLDGAAQARKEAYKHSGRFDASRLRQLDQRANATSGDQFNYRVKQDGSLYANSSEALASREFLALLDDVESALTRMGREIYAGVARVDPFRNGRQTACDHCDYAAACRIDPWTHQYRVLKKPAAEEAE